AASAAARGAAERADSTRQQPSAAKALAAARPIPRLEPVISATLSFSFRSIARLRSGCTGRASITWRTGPACRRRGGPVRRGGPSVPANAPQQHAPAEHAQAPQRSYPTPAGGACPGVSSAAQVMLDRRAHVNRYVLQRLVVYHR